MQAFYPLYVQYSCGAYTSHVLLQVLSFKDDFFVSVAKRHDVQSLTLLITESQKYFTITV